MPRGADGSTIWGWSERPSRCAAAADNPISGDAKSSRRRRRRLEAHARLLPCGRCQTLVGPYHSAIGEFSGKGPTADEWKWGVDSMRQVAEHAEQAGVGLAVEYLNRFEMLPAEHGGRYRPIHSRGEPSELPDDVRHLSCQHRREEPGRGDSNGRAADDLVHISENDRSTPGTGNIPWTATFDALKSVGYHGWLVVEAFGLACRRLWPRRKISPDVSKRRTACARCLIVHAPRN